MINRKKIIVDDRIFTNNRRRAKTPFITTKILFDQQNVTS